MHRAATANLVGLSLFLLSAAAIAIYERRAARAELAPVIFAIAPAVSSLILMVVSAPFASGTYRKQRSPWGVAAQTVTLFLGGAVGFAWLGQKVFWTLVTLDFQPRTERIWFDPWFVLPQIPVGLLVVSRVLPRRKRL